MRLRAVVLNTKGELYHWANQPTNRRQQTVFGELTNERTNKQSSSDLSSYREAARRSDTIEFPNTLWSPNVHNSVPKCPPPAPIISQINPVHTAKSSLRSISMLSSHLHLHHHIVIFPSGFPIKTLYVVFFLFVLNTIPISSFLTLSFEIYLVNNKRKPKNAVFWDATPCGLNVDSYKSHTA
jgi:hypothetical protein